MTNMLENNPFILGACKALGYESLRFVPADSDNHIDILPPHNDYPLLRVTDKDNPNYARVTWYWQGKLIRYEWEYYVADGEISTLTIPDTVYPESVLMKMQGKILNDVVEMPGADRAVIALAEAYHPEQGNPALNIRMLLDILD
jgi:hypothetical protein